MILIAYLNENFTDWNENLAWGKREPLIHSYSSMFLYQSKYQKFCQNFILHSFHVVIITFESFQIVLFSLGWCVLSRVMRDEQGF